jgi:hypothetical protein
LPQGHKIVSLPEGIEDMSQLDQKSARDDVAVKNMEIYYRAVVTHHALYYYKALTEAYTTLFTTLALSTSLSWGGMFHIVCPLVIPIRL